jgi:hypothetical protein
LILLHPIRWLDGHAAKVVSEIVFDARYGCFAIGAGASQLSATISSRINHGEERVVNDDVRSFTWRSATIVGVGGFALAAARSGRVEPIPGE